MVSSYSSALTTVQNNINMSTAPILCIDSFIASPPRRGIFIRVVTEDSRPCSPRPACCPKGLEGAWHLPHGWRWGRFLDLGRARGYLCEAESGIADALARETHPPQGTSRRAARAAVQGAGRVPRASPR